MKEQIKGTANRMPKSEDKNLELMSLANVAKARFFHSSFPQYSVTPLARLDGMARYLGLAGLFVKDESFRFGLNAFKVLGGSFAMARYIAKEMGRDVSEMTYDYLTSEAFRREFGHATFFTATDGNHGRGVAGRSPAGSEGRGPHAQGQQQARYDNIAKEGAQVTIEEVNYDAASAWPPPRPPRPSTAWWSRTPPGRAMRRSLLDHAGLRHHGRRGRRPAAADGRQPPHPRVRPGGVGSLAGAVVGFFTNLFPNILPSSWWWRPGRRTACTRALWPAMAIPASWTAICRPSWRAWPAASPTSSPGTSCATTSPPSSPAPTGFSARVCGCWACPQG